MSIFSDLQKQFLKSSAQDPDPQDFGFLDPYPQKYYDPLQGVKYQPKTAKKKTFLHLKPKSELLKKNKNFLIFEWFIKLQDKNK